MSKKTTTKFILGIIMMNIFVGIALFCNRPEQHEIGYEKIIQEAERESENVSKSPNHQQDRTLVGL